MQQVVQWAILTIFKLYCHIYEFTAQCKDSAQRAGIVIYDMGLEISFLVIMVWGASWDPT